MTTDSHPVELLGRGQLADTQGPGGTSTAVSKFPALLTRGQHLAVPSFRGAEDKTATGPVVVQGVTSVVVGADTGVPLVSGQASTMGRPIVLDTALCDREGCLRKPADRTNTCLMAEGPRGWVPGTVPKSHPPVRDRFLCQGAVEVMLGKGIKGGDGAAGPTMGCPLGPLCRRWSHGAGGEGSV